MHIYSYAGSTKGNLIRCWLSNPLLCDDYAYIHSLLNCIISLWSKSGFRKRPAAPQKRNNQISKVVHLKLLLASLHCDHESEGVRQLVFFLAFILHTFKWLVSNTHNDVHTNLKLLTKKKKGFKDLYCTICFSAEFQSENTLV